jgi:hypothetical protein
MPAGTVDEDHLGQSVAIANDVIAAGAPFTECADGVRCGAAFLFRAPWIFSDGFESGDVGGWAAAP